MKKKFFSEKSFCFFFKKKHEEILGYKFFFEGVSQVSMPSESIFKLYIGMFMWPRFGNSSISMRSYHNNNFIRFDWKKSFLGGKGGGGEGAGMGAGRKRVLILVQVQ